MTRIAFQPERREKNRELSEDTVTHAAWLFAYASLWQEQDIKPDEVLWAKREIARYFQLQEDRQLAFTNFCARVTIANRYAGAEKCKVIFSPYTWFRKDFAGGFYATLRLHEHLQAHRDEVPELWEGICTLARHYWEYIQKPSKRTFSRCRNRLLSLKEYGLIQLFYTVIIYSQFLTPGRYGTVNR